MGSSICDHTSNVFNRKTNQRATEKVPMLEGKIKRIKWQKMNGPICCFDKSLLNRRNEIAGNGLTHQTIFKHKLFFRVFRKRLDVSENPTKAISSFSCLNNSNLPNDSSKLTLSSTLLLVSVVKVGLFSDGLSEVDLGFTYWCLHLWFKSKAAIQLIDSKTSSMECSPCTPSSFFRHKCQGGVHPYLIWLSIEKKK